MKGLLLRVWIMVPSRTFAGESFLFRALSDNYDIASIAAEKYCVQKTGYPPERIELA